VYEGITVNKLPYEIKGLTVTSITFSGTKATVRVTNNTGYAISSMSSISYKCYDNSGTILKTSNLYLENMNNGETAEVYFYMESGTGKILFDDASIYKGETSGNHETAMYEGIAVNKLPYEVKGLTITSVSFSGTKVTVLVTNNTGYAISSMTNINYKCYNASGIILKTSNLYLENMNSGETAEVYFYVESGTSKIVFDNAAIYK
jgi:hypothetical protein